MARSSRCRRHWTTRPRGRRAVELIRSLVDRIEVLPLPERGRCDVTLVGALAGILAPAQNDDTAGSGRNGGGAFLLVAEARNHLYRTVTTWDRSSPAAVAL